MEFDRLKKIIVKDILGSASGLYTRIGNRGGRVVEQ